MTDTKSKPVKYVLVDFENVQPKNLELLGEHPFTVLVFIGVNQAKLPRHFAIALQKLGEAAEYVEIEGSGPNALDFHIAYYIGELVGDNPKAKFYVVSKDKGFDPLIRHLKRKKIVVARVSDIAEIPELRMSKSTGSDEKIDAIVKNLKARGPSRPRKIKGLQNTINNLFTGKLNEKELNAMIARLQERKVVTVKQDKVSYKFK